MGDGYLEPHIFIAQGELPLGGGLADQRGGLGSKAEDHRWSYELRDERRE
jgi:hypothetical protein